MKLKLISSDWLRLLNRGSTAHRLSRGLDFTFADKISNWEKDVFFDVLQQGLDERSTDILDATLQPHIIVQKVSLACKDSQVDGKVVIFTVDNWHEALLDFLSNI